MADLAHKKNGSQTTKKLFQTETYFTCGCLRCTTFPQCSAIPPLPGGSGDRAAAMAVVTDHGAKTLAR